MATVRGSSSEPPVRRAEEEADEQEGRPDGLAARRVVLSDGKRMTGSGFGSVDVHVAVVLEEVLGAHAEDACGGLWREEDEEIRRRLTSLGC